MSQEHDKLSSAKSVIFRPGPGLRVDIEALAAELSRDNAKVTISDILREGISVFWPQIRAFLRARSAIGTIPPEDLAKIVDAARSTVELGLTPEEAETALRNALKAKIAG
jgi:hypothetical protein